MFVLLRVYTMLLYTVYISSHGVMDLFTCLCSLQDAFASSEVPVNALQDALRSLDLLRRTIHPLNKRLAEVSRIISSPKPDQKRLSVT